MPTPAVTDAPAVSEEACATLGRDLMAIGAAHGLVAVGIAGAQPFTETRAILESRRHRGLAGDMQFTYRNPGRSTEPERILRGARSLVVGALGYLRDDDGSDGSGRAAGGAVADRPRGTIARYARDDHYRRLRTVLQAMAERISADGWQARVVVDDNALVDRAAAQRAGLGWVGRNTLLLVPGVGSWCVLGSVVTDAPLAPTAPAGPSANGEGCGSCRRCRTACPTGALVDDGVLDARRCLAWLAQAPGPFPVEFRAALGDRIYGCDDCQQACPVNRTGARHHLPPAPEPTSVAHVDLLDLLASSDADLLDAHSRWYIADRDPRFLRRNALVALGNVGDGADPDTRATLARYADGADELLAEHARWALAALARATPVDGAPAAAR